LGNAAAKSFLFFIVLCSLFLVLCSPSLFASGRRDTADQVTINNEWILCVTAFDLSSLSPARRMVGEVIKRSLVDKLHMVSYRLRISPEYAYYEGYAWQQTVHAAARALSQRQEERSRMLFRGEPNWRYRNNLKRIDADIERLREDFLKKEAEKPLIHREPTFGLTQGNINRTFPEPPRAGAERRFCRDQGADAFLTGEIREFHGRFFLTLRLFALYTNSFIYEDSIIFSMDDIDGAIEEVAARLTAVLAGNRPASVAIKAEPPDAQILINHSFAGRGTVEARDRPPGNITVAIAAEGFIPETVETKLVAGELTEIDVTLVPLYFSEVNILAPENYGAAVYHGALYVGKAPLTLRLPVEQLNYVVVEVGENEMGKAVFTSPYLPGEMYDISLRTRMYPPSGERRVNRARSWYYWAWGGTWVTAIAAWVTNGIFSSQNEALQHENFDQAFFESTQRMYYISTGALIVVGAVVTYKFFQLGRYLYTATENVTPIVRQERTTRQERTR
jgi:hypothetical protein